MQSSNRDYWKISSRNFIALAVFLGGLQVFSYFTYSSIMAKMGNPGQTLPVSEFVFPLLIVGLLIIIGILFRKRNRLAIPISYIFVGVGLVLNVMIDMNILAVLLSIYLLFTIYKAQKTA